MLNDYIPIDMHCHGIGKFDFVEPSNLVLDTIETQLRIEGSRSIVTLYIPHSKIPDLIELVNEFTKGKISGKYTHLCGIALEGPLLASFGGTPEQGCWTPTEEEWELLASLDLTYIVLSPDADIGSSMGNQYPRSLEWIIDTLYKNNVRPALGHFVKTDPDKSAYLTRQVIDHVEEKGYPPLFTDHLFNDMPLLFKNSWRTQEEKERRDVEVAEIGIDNWTLDNMEQTLGPVPAAIINGAQRGLVKVCLNFDGEHVDLEICKAAIRLVGSENLMLMTDRIQSHVLAGQALTSKKSTTLLYQNQGIVAGGSLSLGRQIMNMLMAGLKSQDIVNICVLTASKELGIRTMLNQHHSIDLKVA